MFFSFLISHPIFSFRNLSMVFRIGNNAMMPKLSIITPEMRFIHRNAFGVLNLVRKMLIKELNNNHQKAEPEKTPKTRKKV